MPGKPDLGPSPEAGFSIVEGLIASVILLIVVLGVLPLVTQSMANNVQGNTSSEQANGIVDGLEELLSLPFNAPEMTVASGQPSLVSTDHRDLDERRWQAGAGTGTQQFTRTSTVEIFTVNDIDNDGDYTFDTPQDGSIAVTDPGTVAFKRIQMTIDAARVFSSNRYRVTVIQSY
jgi:Tfp pilus assembly protein PilV